MNDIKISYADLRTDIAFTVDDLEAEKGLETSILISLFSDARANGERGWWGDAIEGNQIGSKLWLLGREKLTETVRLQAQKYAEEALGWMIEDSVASAITVTAELERPSRLNLLVEITRPNDKTEKFRFNNIWNEQSKLY